MDTTTIVWATDGSKSSDGALDVVRDFTKRWKNPRIVAVHIHQRFAGRAGDVPRLADEEDIEAKIEAQVRELQDHGFDATVEFRHTHRGNQASVISGIAADFDADVIVVGTRGRWP